MPLGIWFRGNLRELFADTLLSSASLQRGYFQPAFVRQIVDEHLTGKRDHTLRLWQLVVFEQWHRAVRGHGGWSIHCHSQHLHFPPPRRYGRAERTSGVFLSN